MEPLEDAKRAVRGLYVLSGNSKNKGAIKRWLASQDRKGQMERAAGRRTERSG